MLARMTKRLLCEAKKNKVDPSKACQFCQISIQLLSSPCNSSSQTHTSSLGRQLPSVALLMLRYTPTDILFAYTVTQRGRHGR